MISHGKSMENTMSKYDLKLVNNKYGGCFIIRQGYISWNILAPLLFRYRKVLCLYLQANKSKYFGVLSDYFIEKSKKR